VTLKPAEPGWARRKRQSDTTSQVVSRGRLLFELGGVNEAMARESMLAGCEEAADQDKIRDQRGGCKPMKRRNTESSRAKKLERTAPGLEGGALQLEVRVSTQKLDQSPEAEIPQAGISREC